jgi:hypothetical protein
VLASTAIVPVFPESFQDWAKFLLWGQE